MITLLIKKHPHTDALAETPFTSADPEPPTAEREPR